PGGFWGGLVARRRIAAAVAGALATAAVALVMLTGSAGWGPGIHSVREWIEVLREREGPWGLVTTRDSSLRENNEALPVVLARTFGDLDPTLTRNAVSLAHLPLRVIWGIWLAVLAALMATWALCAWSARRASPPRAWLGMFALTAVVMLMASPIVWPHYFIWLLPATLFLTHRPHLLVAVLGVVHLGIMILMFVCCVDCPEC